MMTDARLPRPTDATDHAASALRLAAGLVQGRLPASGGRRPAGAHRRGQGRRAADPPAVPLFQLRQRPHGLRGDVAGQPAAVVTAGYSDRVSGPAVSQPKALAEHLAPLLGRSVAALDVALRIATPTTLSAFVAPGHDVLGQGDPDHLPGPAVPEPRRAGQVLGAARRRRCRPHRAGAVAAKRQPLTIRGSGRSTQAM